LPVRAQEPRSFRSDSALTPRRNGSCDSRQATDTEGKVPKSFDCPNRDEPSRRRLAAMIYRSLML
jgi:hypothetical protein